MLFAVSRPDINGMSSQSEYLISSFKSIYPTLKSLVSAETGKYKIIKESVKKIFSFYFIILTEVFYQLE